MSESINRATEVLGVHEIIWIDGDVGYDCGCNEHGYLNGMPTRSSAIAHQVQALADHGLLATPKRDAEQRRIGAIEALRGVADHMDRDPALMDVATSLRERADRIEAQR